MRAIVPFMAGVMMLAAITAAHTAVSSGTALEHLAVPFVANAGQWPDSDALFGARILGGNAWILRDGSLAYAVPKPDPADPKLGRVAVLTERLRNAGTPAPRGLMPSATQVNFFTGENANWRSGAPAFAGVDLGEVYPGIRLTLHARGRNIEKIFRVASGADPGRIRLEVEGADSIRVNDAGELELATSLGELRFTAPVAWQEGPDGARFPVTVAYALDGFTYGFRLGERQPGLPLVIDPLFAATFAGGAADDVVRDMATDGSGNIYLTGYTWSPNFPMAGSPPQPAWAGNTDVFVAKLNSTLSQLLAATYLGGPYADRGAGIAFSSNASAVYVTGEAGAGFPVTAGAYSTNFHPGFDWYVGDAFVAKLNTDLSVLQAATYLGGTRGDGASRVAVRPGGGVAVAGWTCSSDFPATPGAYDTTYNGGSSGIADVFAALFNASLSSLEAATYLGASGYETPSGLALDGAGNVFVAGHTLSRYFPTSAGAYRTNWYGNANFYDGFISKFSPTLGALSASTFFGGVNDDTLHAAVLDPYGGLVVAGQTDSGDLPVSYGAFDRFLDGPSDAYLARLNTDLTELLASTYLGGSETETATALALDPLAYVLVAGTTRSLTGADIPFPVSATAYHTNRNADGFICRFDLSLSSLNASTLLGGPSNTAFAALAVTGSNRLTAAGATDSDAFPTTAGAYSRVRRGSNDCFVAMLDLDLSCGDPALAAPSGVTAGNAVSAVKIPVSWNAAAGATGYTVWRATLPIAGRAVRLADTAATSYDDTSAAGTSWYYYWVSARHGADQSPLAGPALGARHAPAYKDYDGDGRSDLAVFETYSGAWYVLSTATGLPVVWNEPWGWPGAVPVAGDFNGDALCDLAVFDRATGQWYIRSLTGPVLAWGLQTGAGASPVAADYDADGRDDAAVFFTQGGSAGYWMIISLAYPDYTHWINWGWAGGWPVPGPYQYPTRADLAVFDTGSGNWFIRNMDQHVVAWAVPWGWPGAIPVAGDYDGDGLNDLAVFDANTGHWYVRTLAGTLLAWAVPWGWPGALPMAGDYDGDAVSDLTVFDVNTGYWYSRAVAERVILWAQPWGWPGAWPVGWGL